MRGVFAVGHRVIVKDVNGYDEPQISIHFGPMAGHYGHVIVADPPEDDEPVLIGVHIVGRVGGPVSPGIEDTLFGQADRTWYFYAEELDHAD